MRIVSLSTVYPNAAEPALGLFVESRLRALAQLADVRIIAPIPLINYRGGLSGMRSARALRPEQQGPQVLHPRWFYPPGGTPITPLFLYARLLPVLRRLHRVRPFDIIDSHFCYPEGVAASLLASHFHVPFSVTLRGSELAFAAHPSRLAAMRYALRRASALIGVSTELWDFAVRQGAAPENSLVIPNGVDAGTFYPRDRDSMRGKWQVAPGRRVIVSAGELIEAKGHHLVIGTAHRLLQEGSDVEVIIAGRTGRGGVCYEAQLRQLVTDLRLASRVRFAGRLDRQELAELLSVADLFCLASYTEGWPNVVHEALSCGAPVVVTDVGGARALVPDVQYGFVCASKDPDALHAAASQALRKDWDRSGIAKWGSSRSWQRVASEVLSLFRNVLAQQDGNVCVSGHEAVSAR